MSELHCKFQKLKNCRVLQHLNAWVNVVQNGLIPTKELRLLFIFFRCLSSFIPVDKKEKTVSSIVFVEKKQARIFSKCFQN